MDAEIAIKQEPLDYTEFETNYESPNLVEFAPNEYVKVEYGEDTMNEMHVDREQENMTQNLPTIMNDKLSILAEKSNFITVSAGEPIKAEDELYFFKQSLAEEEHAYAKADDGSKILFKSSLLPNVDATRKSKHYDCRKNCGRKFTTLTERALHESHEHKSSPRTIKCNFCNRNFDSFFALTRHMPEHRNVQRYVCTHCSKCCSSYLDLQNHWKTSIGCYNKEFDSSKNTPPQIVLEEPRKIPILKAIHSNSTAPTTEKDVAPYNQKPLTRKVPKKQVFSNIQTPLLLLPPVAPAQSQLLSFAEETKAFAAKYQLKSSLVVKKRTSAVVVNPLNTKRQKRSRKSQNAKFETISKYAVPNAIGPSDFGIANPLLNVKIKEEPLDEYDEQLTTQNDSKTLDEVQIKNEPLDDYIEIKKEPIDDAVEESNIRDNFENNLESGFKSTNIKEAECTTISKPTLPLNNIAQHNGSNSLKSLKIIKLGPANSNDCDKTLPLITTKLDAKLGNTDAMTLKNVKIVKLAPNAKIIKLPTVKIESLKNSNINSLTPTASTTESITNQKSPPIPALVPIKLPYSSVQSEITTNEPLTVQAESPIKKENGELSSGLRSVDQAISKGKIRKRINWVPKEIMRCIEQQPQNIKVIEDFQRQILLANKMSSTLLPKSIDTKKEKLPIDKQKSEEKFPCNDTNKATNSNLPLPISYFLSVTDFAHPELNRARRIYHNYRFSWICPQCPKRYSQKHAFLGHLVSTHDMCREEFENLVVEVRPSFDETKFNKNSNERKKNESLNNETTNEFLAQQKDKEIKASSYSDLQCVKCKRICSSRTMLNDHLAGDCGRVPVYQCSECPKAFYAVSTLNCHLSIHTGELPHKCNYCDKRFRTRGQVTVHHRTHTGERPFSCQICSQRFTHRETLISHLSRHIGMKRYRCYACGRHFSCVSGLKTHHEHRPNTCGLVKLNTRAVGPRVRVIRGQVLFEPQPEINSYLRTEDPQEILSEIQNFQKTNS